MRELIVVRHGETEGNVAGIAQGRRPYPLTARGRAQADAAGRLVHRLGWRPVHLVTSPVARCVETAAIVAARLGAGPARPDEAFTEIDCGRAEGLAITPDADGFAAYGGESREVLFARVAAGLEALPPDESTLIVTHGGVFKAIVRELLGFDGWLGLRCGTCLRLERRRGRTAFTHFLHPEEVE